MTSAAIRVNINAATVARGSSSGPQPGTRHGVRACGTPRAPRASPGSARAESLLLRGRVILAVVGRRTSLRRSLWPSPPAPPLREERQDWSRGPRKAGQRETPPSRLSLCSSPAALCAVCCWGTAQLLITDVNSETAGKARAGTPEGNRFCLFTTCRPCPVPPVADSTWDLRAAAAGLPLPSRGIVGQCRAVAGP